jgi:hypothetical protein
MHRRSLHDRSYGRSPAKHTVRKIDADGALRPGLSERKEISGATRYVKHCGCGTNTKVA